MPSLESTKCDKGSVLEIRPTANLWVKKKQKSKKTDDSRYVVFIWALLVIKSSQ